MRATVAGWTRFRAAQESADRNMSPASGSRRFRRPHRQRPGCPQRTRAAPQENDALYREFLEWRATRAKASTSR